MKYYLSALSAIGLTFIANCALSGSSEATSNWFVGFSGSATWASLNQSSTTTPNGSSAPSPYDNDTYSINSNDTNSSWSFFAGYRWQRESNFIPHYSLAIRYLYTTQFTIRGDVEQYSLPDFTNYSYSIEADSESGLLQGKMDVYDYHGLEPYLSFGLGIASNTTNNYNETAYPGIIARNSPDFQQSSSTQFSYNVGVGLDYLLTDRFTVSLGYEYNNLGKLISGNGTSTWANNDLDFGNISTNSLIMSITCQLA